MIRLFYKQLFLLSQDKITIWQQQDQSFHLIEANEQAKRNEKYQYIRPLSQKEEPLLFSLADEAIKKQQQLQHTAYLTEFTFLPLSSDTLAIIEKQEEPFFPSLTSSSETMMEVSLEHIVTKHSPSYETITGFSKEDLNGKSLFEFVHKEDVKKVHHALTKTKKTKTPVMIQWRLWNIQDTYIWVETSLSPLLNELGEINSFLLIGRDVTKKKENEDKLYHLAFHDPLTELPNRRLFTEQLKQSVYQFERKKVPFAVFLLDCDHFKQINDTYGHDVGDAVIKGFAHRVKGLIRKSDILSRFGGDEFSLLLPAVGSKEDVEAIAYRIIEKIQEPWVFEDVVIHTTTSVGVFYADEKTSNLTIDRAIKNADVALYQAKNNGKNHFKLYENQRAAHD